MVGTDAATSGIVLDNVTAAMSRILDSVEGASRTVAVGVGTARGLGQLSASKLASVAEARDLRKHELYLLGSTILAADWKYVLALVLWSCACVALLVELPAAVGFEAMGPQGHRPWLNWFEGAARATAGIGSFLSFLLIFRIFRSYDRWWEARKVWGTVIGKSVRTAQLAKAYVRSTRIRDRIFGQLIALPILLACQLSDKPLSAERERLVVEMQVLSDEQLTLACAGGGWPAGFAIELLRDSFLEAMRDEGLKATASEATHSEVLRSVEDVLEHFCAAIGQLMRIKGTGGQPHGIRGYLQATLFLYAVFLPLTWAPSLGWLLPPFALVLFVIMFGLADLAVRLERPFSSDTNALDMPRFCLLVQKNVKAIQQRSPD